MITRIETLNFRCLRYVSQELKPFQILVGPNASGKTTFLDVIAFLGKLVSDGLEAAVYERTQNLEDLLWRRTGKKFDLAVEAEIPEDYRQTDKTGQQLDTIRYEVSIGFGNGSGETSILNEQVLLKSSSDSSKLQQDVFPQLDRLFSGPQGTIITRPRDKKSRTAMRKVPGGNDNFYSEVTAKSGRSWAPSFKLGPQKSTLGNLPADESKFPASTWLKQMLIDGVQKLVLNSMLIRKASPPGQIRGFKPDGSNLPWVIHRLKETSPERFTDWIAHLQTALPDIGDIETIERQDDRHRYLVIHYEGGLDVPSWTASDGTLRLLALTIPAYITDLTGIYLIEEPENGIHPRAVESVYQSLSSTYNAQILMASHSPVILSVAQHNEVLCFSKTCEGSTEIVSGDKHPKLKDWRGEVDLGTLFASGVLG